MNNTPFQTMSLKKIFCFISAILFILSGSIFVYYNHLKDLSGVENLSFGYGDILENLRSNGEYIACEMSYMPEGLCFSGHRIPFITYFLWFASILLNNNILLIVIFKNILTTILLLKSFQYVYNRTNNKYIFLILISFILTFPRWFLHYFQINTEEPYIIPFFAFVICYLFFKSNKYHDFILFTISVLGLLYSKNSLLFVVLVSPILYFIQYKDISKAIILSTVIVMGMTSLAYFNYEKAGKFTISSSWEGWNLYKGNNPHTLKYYPEKSLDELDYLGLIPGKSNHYSSEWEYSKFLKDRAIDFIQQNPFQFLQLLLLKTYLFFLAPISPDCCAPSGALRFINNLYLFFYRILFLGSLSWFFYRIYFKKTVSQETLQVTLIYITILILFSGFYIIGFVYERHITPIILPTVFYLIKIAPISIEKQCRTMLKRLSFGRN